MKRSNWAGWLTGVVTCVGVTVAVQAGAPVHAVHLRPTEFEWQKLQPELKDRSAEMAILFVDPKTRGMQVMMRVPKNFHMPNHWLTANEMRTLIQGTYFAECDGKLTRMEPGSWHLIPSKMPHQDWTSPTEGALILITVDSEWDFNWVGQVPRAEDFVGGRTS